MNQIDFNFETINSQHLQQFLEPSTSSQQDRRPIRSCLIVAATGLGKTVLMGGLANHWPEGRVMMISHRYELNSQAIKSFEAICGEDVELEQAGFHADRYGPGSRIVVASVQTLCGRRKGRLRMEKFDPMTFGLLMIDEAHRSAAVSYRRIIEYFSQNPNLCVVGVTATPDRSDSIGLGCNFEHVACDYNLNWAIQNGWLVAPEQKFVQVDGLDLKDVKTTGGDLDTQQLARIVEQEENLHGMAKPIVDLCGKNKQCIVFTASVSQAHRLAELIRDYYSRVHGEYRQNVAVSIDGSLQSQDPRRLAIVRGFKDGEIQFLVNMGIATEGFDAPATSVIAVGRPTKSRALYTQIIGRGTRPLPGVVDGLATPEERIAAIAASAKPRCTVLDFVGQAGRHSLVCTVDILAGSGEPPEVIQRAKKIQNKGTFDGSALDAIEEAKEQLENEREARRKRVTVGVQYQLVDQGSLYDMSIVGQVKVPNYLKSKPATEKQKRLLIKLGYTSIQIDQMNPRSASAAIDHAVNNPKNGFAKWAKANWKPRP